MLYAAAGQISLTEPLTDKQVGMNLVFTSYINTYKTLHPIRFKRSVYKKNTFFNSKIIWKAFKLIMFIFHMKHL